MTSDVQNVTATQTEVAKRLFHSYRDQVRKDLKDGEALFGEKITYKQLEWEELATRTREEYLQQAEDVILLLGQFIKDRKNPYTEDPVIYPPEYGIAWERGRQDSLRSLELLEELKT